AEAAARGRKVGRKRLAGDDHVARAIGRDGDASDLLALAAAEEGRPLEPGVDVQGELRVVASHFEAVVPLVDDPEARFDELTLAGRQNVPGPRRGLPHRSARVADRERSVALQRELRRTVRANYDLFEIGLRLQEHVVFE